MTWLCSVLLLLCLSSTTFSQLDDDYDCDYPPPLGVEPLTCCRVSKPFDRFNFPECFASSLTTTSIPPIPVSEHIFDDRDDDENHNHDNDDDDNDDDSDDHTSPTNGPSGKDDKNWDWKKDKHHGYGHWPSKYHWGYDNHRHFHDDHHGGDYHRLGYHSSRHRRQVIYRINSAQPPAPAIPIDLLTRTVDRCTKQLRNYLIGRRRRNRNQLGRNYAVRRCRNGSGLFAACFNREIYRNCLADLDTDGEDCDTLRSFIDNCSPIRGIRNNFSYDNVDVDENGNFIPNN